MGQVAKTRKDLKKYYEFATQLLVLVDARAPKATFDIKITQKHKNVTLIFSKVDLADPNLTTEWKRWFQEHGFKVALSKKQAFDDLQHAVPKAQYVIIAGFPNVGKSTFINELVRKQKTKTGAAPGITQGPQWVKITSTCYLLDTPGVFFPHRMSDETTWRLAVLNVIPEKIYHDRIVEFCELFIRYIRNEYGLFQDQPQDFFALLESFGKKRGLLTKGGNVNLEQTSRYLFTEFQKGKWSRITLEKPV